MASDISMLDSTLAVLFRRLNTSPLIRKVEQRHKLIHAAGAWQFRS